MKRKININYLCIAKLKESNNFILLKEKFDCKKIIDCSSYPFSYYDLRDNYKTKYDSSDIEEAYDYGEFHCNLSEKKVNKEKLINREINSINSIIRIKKMLNKEIPGRLK